MRTLVIPDLHLPYTHPGALQFCKDLYRTHKCNTTVFLGDIVDHTGISRHEKSPEAPSSNDELALVGRAIRPWYRAFPKAYVCAGNHDFSRVTRQAAEVNIPETYLRPLNELWGTPEWKWADRWRLDGVTYLHGLGAGGKYHAANIMEAMLSSVVVGHVHTVGMIYWKANFERRIFGMDCGCLVDDRAVAFQYARNVLRKSILAAGTVIDGMPELHLMPMARGEKYHRSNFVKRRFK